MGAGASHAELGGDAPAKQAAEGLLLEQGGTLEGWVQRYGVLRDRTLFLYASEADAAARRPPLSAISLGSTLVSTFAGYQSNVVFPEGTVFLETAAGPSSPSPSPTAGAGSARGRVALQVFVADERAAWLRALRLASREPWRGDAERPACFVCDVPFDAVGRRRHHCRRCGELVCAACSTRREALPDLAYDAEVRVCVGCAGAGGPVPPAGERVARKAAAEADAEALRRQVTDAEAERRRAEAGGAAEARRARGGGGGAKRLTVYGSFGAKRSPAKA